MSSTSATKNFFKYVGILFGICLAVVLVVLGVMVLFKVEVFGYKYVKINASSKDAVIINHDAFNEYPTAWPDALELIDKISINADNVDVIVKPWVELGRDNTSDPLVGQFTVIPNINAQGFAKVSERGPLLKMDVNFVEYDEVNHHYEIKIDVSCPSGIMSYGTSHIVLQTPFLSNRIFTNNPEAYGDSGKYGNHTSINIFNYTGEYGDVVGDDKLTIDRINTLHLKELNIETTSGSITVSDGLKGINNETTAKGLIYADTIKTKTTTGNLELHRCGLTNLDATSDKGDMTFSKLTNYTIPGNVTINNNMGKVTFEDGINLGYGTTAYSNKSKVMLHGQLNQMKLCSIINTAVTYTGDADKITIDSILFSSVELESNNAHINIGSIYGNSAIHLSYNSEDAHNSNSTGYRTIDIDYVECNDNFGLSTWGGAVNINTLINKSANDNATTIITEGGNITINELIGNTELKTKSGNITVAQRILNFTNDDDQLKERHANSIYSLNLKSKQTLLEDYQNLKIAAIKNHDSKYEEELNEEISKLDSQINRIKYMMNIEKNNSTLFADYASRQKDSSHIKATTTSGTIKLNNLLTRNLDVTVLDNGPSNMDISFHDLSKGNSTNAINITSGRGDVNITVPGAKYFWLYAKQGAINASNTGLLMDTLNEGYCNRANGNLENPIKVKTSPDDTTPGAKTIEEIIEMDEALAFMTIASSGGTTTMHRAV